MATVVGTVSAKHGTTKPVGPLPTITISAAEHEVFVHYVEVIFGTGTYASGDDAEFDPTTVLESSRSGKTFVVLNAMCAAHGDEDGDIVGMGLTISITSNVVKAPITQEDGTTERANGAMAAAADWNRPITMALYVAETPAD